MEWTTLKVKHIERLIDDAVRVDFDISQNEAFQNFKSGQYITLRKNFDGQEIRRSYSICSTPHAQTCSIGIKEVPGGLFSTFANRQLQVGDQLEVMLPQGNFINVDETEEEKVFTFIAAGSGITPVLSMIKSTLANTKNSEVILFYGNRNVKSIMFLEELEDLKNTYLDRFRSYYILSRQEQDSPLLSGRIDKDKIDDWDNVFLDIKEVDAFFLCGPETMIIDATKALKNKGVDASRIHFELFTSDLAKVARQERMTEVKENKSDTVSHVVMKVNGKDTRFDFSKLDDNILDTALQHGADLPFACKGGVCCTCKARLIEGEVKMYVNYGLEPDEIENDFILTCQAYPLTSEVVVDFDDV